MVKTMAKLRMAHASRLGQKLELNWLYSSAENQPQTFTEASPEASPTLTLGTGLVLIT